MHRVKAIDFVDYEQQGMVLREIWFEQEALTSNVIM